MPHWLIALGAIVGLITGIYTLWERLFALRPDLWLSRTPGRSARGNMVLKVQNPGDHDIVVIGASVKPPIYAVADSWQFDSLVRAASIAISAGRASTRSRLAQTCRDPPTA
jgi:hypothetical protein